MNRYQAELEARRSQDLLRILPKDIKGIDFYSNDYLGFASNPQLAKNLQSILQQHSPHQIGATGSRLLSGNNSFVEKLEYQIAAYHKMEAALIFNSGYTANVGLLSCIAGKTDTLIMDELIHASLIDGARLSRAKRVRFKHNDLKDLKQQLANTVGSKIVVVESIYSMDGDICPLEKVVELCQEFDAKLIIDEAHGIGVFGNKGEGLCSHLGLQKEIFASIMTYGKAMGCHGAAILGPQWLKDYLVNFSRSFIFTTGPAFHQLAAIENAYQYLPHAQQERQQLQVLITYLNKQKQQTNLEWLPSNTAIQSVIIPGNEQVMAKAKYLQSNGIAAMGIRYPSVAKGAERIRICLHAFNTKQDIDYLIACLKMPIGATIKV